MVRTRTAKNLQRIAMFAKVSFGLFNDALISTSEDLKQLAIEGM